MQIRFVSADPLPGKDYLSVTGLRASNIRSLQRSYPVR